MPTFQVAVISMRTTTLLALSISSLLVLAACDRAPETPVAEGTSPAPTTAEAAEVAPVVPTIDGKTVAAITAEDYAARLKRVSSDEFEGRKPGTLGERLTTAWLVDQFTQMGVKPGNNGAWLQTVPMVEARVSDQQNVKLTVTAANEASADFAFNTDMVVGSLDNTQDIDLKDSDIVFIGYGVNAPEQNWNDYAGLDVKGKTLIVLVNDPGWGNQDENLFKGRTLTYYGRWVYKYEEAARQGAAATFIVHETDAAAYPWQVVQNSWGGDRQSLPGSEDPAPRLKVGGWLTTDAARRLFTTAGKDFDALKASADLPGFKPRELGATLSTQFTSSVKTSSSQNVIGVIKGSERPDEVLVYSAHWDHFGKDESLSGDQILNGAVDNGSGVAGLLEIAEAFAKQPTPPKRSVVFAAFTLEEAMLLGSQYYVAHPTFALDKTVANINMDALLMIGPTRDLTVLGLGQSEMDDLVKVETDAQGRSIHAEDAPEKGFFFRSDHLNFARAGVPSLYAGTGVDLIDGGIEKGRALSADYVTSRYHKPSDEYDPNWDFRGVVQDLQTIYTVGSKLADATAFPAWRPGSDFKRPQ